MTESNTGTLEARIRDDLNNARRARDKQNTTLLSTILSEIKNQKIEAGHELSDGEVIDVLTRAIKKRREAAEQMRAGQRIELAETEEREAATLTGYLPPQLSEDDVKQLVRDAMAGGAENVGAVMKQIAPQIKGRFDGKEANRIVREELG